MTQFIYTHHQGGDGKMVEKLEGSSPNCFRDVYRRPEPVTHPALGFSPSDNGKTFNEVEFEVKYEILANVNGSDTWMNATKSMYDWQPHEDYKRIIAVPLSEKREERTQDELWEEVGKIIMDGYDNSNQQDVTDLLKSKFSIKLK